MTRPTHSKALVYSGQHGKLELKEIPIPAIKPDQALVRVTACTLCGSDLHSLHGRRQVPMPTILGHEIVGEIVEMGDRFPTRDLRNKPLHRGDPITWAIVANCGSCFYCLRGLEQKCERASKYGHMGFDSQHVLSGGLSEYCVLAPGTHTMKLPEGASLAIFTPASCATATVMAVFDALSPPASLNSSIAILGAGMLGLTACAVAKTLGWKHIEVIEPVADKQEMALRFGANRTLSPETWGADSKSNRGYGFDAVIEMSGAQSMIEPAIESLRIGGELVLVGAVVPVPPISLLPEQVIRRQLTLRGIHNYRPEHLRTAIDFLTQFGTEFPFADMVASWHSLSEVQALVQDGLPSRVVRIGVNP